MIGPQLNLDLLTLITDQNITHLCMNHSISHKLGWTVDQRLVYKPELVIGPQLNLDLLTLITDQNITHLCMNRPISHKLSWPVDQRLVYKPELLIGPQLNLDLLTLITDQIVDPISMNHLIIPSLGWTVDLRLVYKPELVISSPLSLNERTNVTKRVVACIQAVTTKQPCTGITPKPPVKAEPWPIKVEPPLTQYPTREPWPAEYGPPRGPSDYHRGWNRETNLPGGLYTIKGARPVEYQTQPDMRNKYDQWHQESKGGLDPYSQKRTGTPRPRYDSRPTWVTFAEGDVYPSTSTSTEAVYGSPVAPTLYPPEHFQGRGLEYSPENFRHYYGHPFLASAKEASQSPLLPRYTSTPRPSHISDTPCEAPRSPPPVDSSKKSSPKPKRKPSGIREPPRYSGKTDVHDFLSQFKFFCRRNGWDYEDSGNELACSLDREARELCSTLSEEQTCDYDSLSEALRNKFAPLGNESKHAVHLWGRDRQKGEVGGRLWERNSKVSQRCVPQETNRPPNPNWVVCQRLER